VKIALVAVLLAGGGARVESEPPPLLGSSHGGHAWFDYCEGKPADAVLPLDPRSLVRSGVSDGKAVHFNTWWRDCHANPALVGEHPHPKTCGELRASWLRGDVLMRGNGGAGSGSFFGGDHSETGISAANFNELWRLWGLTARPDNFDELVAERYGIPLSPDRNPYPLPGEDPARTNGGSGQLPSAITQLRGSNGEWTGNLGFKCHACHSSAVGRPDAGDGGPDHLYGSGTGLHEIALLSRDFGIGGAPAGAAGLPFALFATSRGTNNAQFGNIVALPYPQDVFRDPTQPAGWINSGSTASMDTPAWWNLGHRPVKFVDGSVPSDASRVDLAFYTPLSSPDSAAWVRAHDQDADHWLLSIKAPVYRLPIDARLAETGAVLFHTKNLWAESLGNAIARPAGGNGSCASCHGAYSPRFANDPAFLADPALAGVASNIAPLRIIDTDPERLYAFNEDVQQSNGGGFEGYPETVGTAEDCGSQNRAELRGDREDGYLAPPLYGVWATAPYFHNGSVPDVWGVLKAEDRPDIWRRWSTPARADQAGQVVMGFDVSLARAYDPAKLGWKYDALACGAGTLPVVECDPLDPAADPLAQTALGAAYGNLLLAWNVGQAAIFTQWAPQQVEDRKTYNTHLFSQGNGGHEFTTVLTDDARRALIEYLKTL
jgi:mono/diheme cytochrome c family protein